MPASAELHRVTVTLITGQKVTLTVDVPPGTPVESIQIPGLPAPVQSIVDLGPVSTATPSPTATATPAAPAPTETPSQTATPAPTEPPADKDDDAPARGNGSGGKRGSQDQTQQPDRLDPNAEALTGELEEQAEAAEPEVDRRNPTRNTDGSPTLDNPTVSLAEPGPARIGVPNFFIEKFRIPPFLLPIYQAAGIEYGVRWEVLAAINEIETDYGRNLNVSSAGALGWMQFMPATWDAYGVDGNQDGLKDPYNPVDAIFAAARYLRAAGADTDLRTAIFAYNHADWYVDSVHPPRALHRRPARRPRRLALRADPGPLPRAGQGDVREGGPAQGPRDGRRPEPGLRRRVEQQPQGHQDLRQGRRAGRRRQRRAHRPHRPQPPARQLRDAAGRLRQHVHLRPPQVGRGALPDAQAAARRPQGGRARAAAAVARRRPAQARLGDDRGRGEGAPQGTGGEGADVEGRAAATVGSEAAKERLFANPDRPNAAAAGGAAQADELSEGFGSYLQPRLRPRPRRRR